MANDDTHPTGKKSCEGCATEVEQYGAVFNARDVLEEFIPKQSPHGRHTEATFDARDVLEGRLDDTTVRQAAEADR